jgi:hypothetical protein
MPTPPRSPAERFAAILLCLGQAVGKRTGWGLHSWVIALITDRLRGIKQRFGRLAALMREGRYVLRRRASGPRPKTAGRPLRSLCRMLGIRPPPPVALPAKPRKKRVPRPKVPEPPLHPPHPPGTPEWLRTMPGVKPWPLSRMLGRRRRPV